MVQSLKRWSQRQRQALGARAFSTRDMYAIYLTMVASASMALYLIPLEADYNRIGHLLVALLALVMLPTMRRPSLYPYITFTMTAAAMIQLVFMAMHTGGIFSMAMVWLTVAGLPALMLQGRRAAMLWIAVSQVLFLTFFVIHQQGWLSSPVKDAAEEVVWTVMNHLMALGCLVVAIWIYDHLYQREQRTIDERNAQLRDIHQALVETQAHKDEFVAAVGHELRTPMNAILGFNGVLREELADAPRLLEQVGHIRRSTERLLQVVNDILAFSQLEAGRLQPHPVDFDLPVMLQETLEALAPKARDKGLDYRLVCEPGLPRQVRGDRQCLQQVLTNLLDNAIKFTLAGRVSLHAMSVAQRIRLEVRDTGVGMSEERQARIFRGFEHVDVQTRTHAGTGLGLILCEKLVRLLGGEIGVHSRLHEGTVFWVELALPASATGLLPAPDFVELPPDEALRVLLVDDNAINLAVARLQLQKIWPRAQITSTNSGAQALQLIDLQAFDVALVDVQMPEMEGPQLTRQIRRHFPEAAARMPIIALTANTQPDERERCLAAGMNEVLHKPMQEGILMRTVSTLVLQARQGRPVS